NFKSSLVKENENAWTVINNANWSRSEVVKIESELEGRFYDNEGNELEAQRENNKYIVEVKNIDGLGFKTIHIKVEEDKNSEEAFEEVENGINTTYYNLRWNNIGQLISIFDRENNREVLAKNQRGNVLQMFEDKPMAHEAWDIDIFYQEKMREV